MADDAVVRRVRFACREVRDSRALRRRVLEALAPLGFDWFVWVLLDPETGIGTSPLAEVPSTATLPRLIAERYRASTRWSVVRTGAPVAQGRDSAEGTTWHAELERLGVSDVLTSVYADRFGRWGALDLWRADGPWTASAIDTMTAVSSDICLALRTSRAATFDKDRGSRPVVDAGPAVLTLSPTLEVRHWTTGAEDLLRQLLPTGVDDSPVPAAAWNVAAHLLAVEQGLEEGPALVRAHLVDGHWLAFRAARLGEGAGADIAVTLQPVVTGERVDLFCRAHGLSPRESDLVHRLAAGEDTRAVAQGLHLSAYTVQDHLKAVFDKTGVRSRRALLARAMRT